LKGGKWLKVGKKRKHVRNGGGKIRFLKIVKKGGEGVGKRSKERGNYSPPWVNGSIKGMMKKKQEKGGVGRMGLSEREKKRSKRIGVEPVVELVWLLKHQRLPLPKNEGVDEKRGRKQNGERGGSNGRQL